MMKVGILKTGSAPEILAEEQGDYDACFRKLFAGPDREFTTYDIEHGEFPESADQEDGWIITGSRHGAYEDHAWIPPLEKLIREIAALKRPLLGICFGHQIIAQALGGKVERADGWIVGPQTYRLNDGGEFTSNAWHRDQVTQVPDGASVIASGDGCPIAALAYDGPIVTVQPHPEFAPAYFQKLMAERGSVLDPAQRSAAEERAATQALDLSPVLSAFDKVMHWPAGAAAEKKSA